MNYCLINWLGVFISPFVCKWEGVPGFCGCGFAHDWPCACGLAIVAKAAPGETAGVSQRRKRLLRGAVLRDGGTRLRGGSTALLHPPEDREHDADADGQDGK